MDMIFSVNLINPVTTPGPFGSVETRSIFVLAVTVDEALSKFRAQFPKLYPNGAFPIV